ncbi:MAG: 50S ribosomal protein L4 [Firmicutes bacterium]|nr:50S ribosomal protein L4 [Bacillota bacterium]
MPKAALYDINGDRVGDLDLSENIFGAPVHKQILHQAVVRHLANRRRGTADTKTRGEVQGSTRKPWRQKGTGRARVGSIRSPLWRGGGIIFGPHPRSYILNLPKKMRRIALKSALAARAQAEDVIVIEDFEIREPKTKAIAGLLRSMEAGVNTLLVTVDRLPLLERVTNNLPGVACMLADQLNAYTLLAAGKIVFTRGALDRLGEVLADA